MAKSKFYCPQCDHEMMCEDPDADWSEAISSFRSHRIIAMLDDLEKELPDEFIGLADDILKWAGKSR